MFTEHGTHPFLSAYRLLLVVEDVLLELLVPALKFFELILQGSLVLGDERLLVLRLQFVELLRTAYILIALRLDGGNSNFFFGGDGAPRNILFFLDGHLTIGGETLILDAPLPFVVERFFELPIACGISGVGLQTRKRAASEGYLSNLLHLIDGALIAFGADILPRVGGGCRGGQIQRIRFVALVEAVFLGVLNVPDSVGPAEVPAGPLGADKHLVVLPVFGKALFAGELKGFGKVFVLAGGVVCVQG